MTTQKTHYKITLGCKRLRILKGEIGLPVGCNMVAAHRQGWSEGWGLETHQKSIPQQGCFFDGLVDERLFSYDDDTAVAVVLGEWLHGVAE